MKVLHTEVNITKYDSLFFVASIWFMSKFLRYVFPPLFPEFQSLYDVSNGVVGLSFTLMMSVYAVMQFPAGIFADYFGSPRVITAGALVTVLGAALLTLPLSFAFVTGAMLFIGIGTGIHKTVSVGFLSTMYPHRSGRALGVLDTFGALGGAVAPVAVITVLNVANWKVLFLLGGILSFTLAGTFYFNNRFRSETNESPASDHQQFGEYTSLLTNRRFITFVLVTVGFSFAYGGVTAFLPLYLVDSIGLNQSFASFLYSLLFVASFVQLSTGELSDRLSPLVLIVGALWLATVSLFVLLVGETKLLISVAVVGFGLGSHGFRPVRGIYLIEVVPDTVSGGGLGVARTLLMAAGALAPAVVGVISDSFSYRLAFMGLFLSLLSGSLVAVILLLTE